MIKNQSNSYDSLISDINESDNKVADIASFAKRIITFKDGLILEDKYK